jgi:hypothetical protein
VVFVSVGAGWFVPTVLSAQFGRIGDAAGRAPDAAKSEAEDAAKE